jgi:PAS domain S-box-containing protein
VLAETAVQNAHDAMFLIDVTDEREFRIALVNQNCEEVTGWSSTDIQGKAPREVVGDEHGVELESHYRTCVERRETIQYPVEIPVDGVQRFWETNLTPAVRDDSAVQGNVRWLSVNAAPLTSTDGDSNAVVATLTELTEEQQDEC